MLRDIFLTYRADEQLFVPSPVCLYALVIEIRIVLLMLCQTNPIQNDDAIYRWIYESRLYV